MAAAPQLAGVRTQTRREKKITPCLPVKSYPHLDSRASRVPFKPCQITPDARCGVGFKAFGGDVRRAFCMVALGFQRIDMSEIA